MNTEGSRVQLEEKCRAVLNNASDGVVLIDIDGRITDANRSAMAIGGFRRKKDVLGRKFLDLGVVSDRDRQRALAAIATVLRGRTLTPFRLAIRNQRGQDRLVECTASAVKIRGEITGVVGIFRDVTEREVAVTALKESEELYRSLVETSPDAITLMDLAGNMVTANLQTARLHGFSSAASFLSAGRNALDWVAPRDRAQMRMRLKRAESIVRIRGVECRLLRKNGSSFPAEVSASLVRDSSGKPKVVILVIRDITDQRHAEAELQRTTRQLASYSKNLEEKVAERTKELERLLASHKEFIAGVSHELRTPLATIKAVVELELENDRHPKVEELSLINRKIDQLTQIIANLGLLSRLDFGQEHLHRSRFNLRHLIDEVVRDVKGDPQKEDFTFELKVDCSKSLALTADRAKLSEILVNLLRNAIVHSKGNPEVSLVVRSRRKLVQIVVADNNPVISAEDRPRVFVKFFRKAAARRPSGLGLGLSISKGLVDLMGGKIWVESGSKTGNQFIVELPKTS